MADTASTATPPARRGLLGRLYEAMIAPHQRQTEREIARYVRHIGGKFTDEAEREIERRILCTPSRLVKNSQGNPWRKRS
ncbi:MAG TPA: hypothetical protein VFB29_10805 [Pseudolabrys sp.]|nr:hypothetical protein [Pseudolabrys sp.]